MDLLYFVITLLIAAAGGLIAVKLKVPAGGMVGSMVFVVIFNVLTDKGFFYGDLRTVLQLVSGAFIGAKVGKEDIFALRKVIWPTVVLLISMVILNLFFGAIIAGASSLDVPTALFATTPGGASDMALISEELGANPGYVAIMQVFRLLIIFIFCPPIFKKIMSKKYSSLTNKAEAAKAVTSGKKNTFDIKQFVILLAVSAACGLIFKAIGVTAGAMIGAMLGGAVLTIFTKKVSFPNPIRTGLQIFSGAFIGVRMNKESLFHMDDLIIPILIMTVGILIFVFVTSFIMHKITGLDYPTCMFASTPGGLQEMSLLSEELGADTVKVAVMQTVRLIFVVSTFPTLNSLIVSLLT